MSYIKSVRTEMSKVIWPTKQEVVTYTGVTVVTCAVFAVAFWAIDSGWLAGLKAAINAFG
jgi:preprotein translocase subunit SecE